VRPDPQAYGLRVPLREATYGPRIRALIHPRAPWRQDLASSGQFELGRKWAADRLTAAIA
jgi:hypothetical protein